MKKELATLLMAVGALTIPMAKGSQTNNVVQLQETAKAEQIKMPSWVPTIKGEFDREGALRQAKELWQSNGKDIQRFADEVKMGVPEEMAYVNLARKLSKGNTKTEKRLLALYDVVRETRQERKGQMTDDFIHRYGLALLIGMGIGVVATFYRMKKDADREMTDDNYETKSGKFYMGQLLINMASVAAVAVGVVQVMEYHHPQVPEAVKTFVAIQEKTFYDFKDQKPLKIGYYADLQQARKKISEAQTR